MIEKLENVRHPSMSHGTWAVGAQLAASPGRLRSAHVTLFMNGSCLTQGRRSSKEEEGEEQGGGGEDAEEVEPSALTQRRSERR